LKFDELASVNLYRSSVTELLPLSRWLKANPSP
jgi:hypothetical protein